MFAAMLGLGAQEILALVLCGSGFFLTVVLIVALTRWKPPGGLEPG